MDRAELTELIATTRAQKGLTWSEVADAVGASKEWVTAGCLGQMTFDAAQAATLVALFELPTEALKLLQTRPHRGSLSTPVPTDPLIYRFCELVSVYCTTFNELRGPGRRPGQSLHEWEIPPGRKVLTRRPGAEWVPSGCTR